MSAGKRYKFNGSTLQVSTGVAATKAITGITKANPAEITATAHGLALGDVARVAGVVGMVEINGQLVVVDNPTTNDFEAANINAAGYTAYASGGTLAPLVYSSFCELTGANQQDGTADEIEVTTICSTAKEFEQGLADSGTLTLDFNFAPTTGIQNAMRAAKRSAEEIAVRLTLPGAGGTIVMIGRVQQTSFQSSNGAVWTGSATLKLTGEIFVLEAA
jgi:hypothetical protein